MPLKLAIRSDGNTLKVNEGNAYTVKSNETSGATGTRPQKTPEEIAKENAEAKEAFDIAMNELAILEQQIERCQYEELQRLAGLDPSTIDLESFKQMLIECDPSLRDVIENLQEVVELVDFYVEEIRERLKTTIIPANKTELLAIGETEPFNARYDEFSLTSLMNLAEVTYNSLIDFSQGFIAQLDSFFVRQLKENFIYTKLAWSETQESIPNRFRDDTDTDTKIGYIKSFHDVSKYLGSIQQSDLIDVNEYGFEEDSPVPIDTQKALVEDIKPVFPNEANSLLSTLKPLKDNLTPKQKQAMLVIESIGFVASRFTSDLNSTKSKISSILTQTVTVLTERAPCEVARVSLSDYVDYTEIVGGYDFCTGEELTITGRLVSSFGLFVGSSKFWRVFAEWAGIAISKGKAVAKNLGKFGKKAADVTEAATKAGAKTERGIEAYTKRVNRKNGQGTISGDIPEQKLEYQRLGRTLSDDQIRINPARGDIREMQAVDLLGKDFDVELLPDGPPGAPGGYPDIEIDGKKFDVFAPISNSPESIAKGIGKKIPRQADRVVVYLSDSTSNVNDLITEIHKVVDYTDPNSEWTDYLKELIIIEKDGRIGQYFPF
ncbi:MAG: hypothetical protein HRU19_30215 [Pseudobacteriovorax sp.]|nr:hypothetical protein [Pseudobacteriovorax sp.]